MVPLELEDAKTRDRAAHWLERVGLGSRFDHYPTQLSGGDTACCPRGLHQCLAPLQMTHGNLGDTSDQVQELLFSLNREEHNADLGNPI